MSKRNFYIRESEADDYQRKVLNRRAVDGGSLIVRGCAGSGKSLIAFWHLHDIVSNAKGSAQVIVFTKSLKGYFVEGCREAEIDTGLIDYYHSWERHPRQTDYILVDEAQDFSRESIEKFRRYANKALLLYGDSSQQLYEFLKYKNPQDAPIDMEEIQRITGFPVEQLVFNHRLPKKIARLAEHVNAENDDLTGRCRNEGDEKPYVLEYASLDDQLDAIVDIIRKKQLDDVGILLPKNEQVRDVARILGEKNLGVEAKFGSRQDEDNLNFATTNPKVMTYHSAKGLQFGAVFLPACDSLTSIKEDFLKAFYVALTRSYQSLYVLYSGQLPTVLQGIPEELYESDLRGKETELL